MFVLTKVGPIAVVVIQLCLIIICDAAGLHQAIERQSPTISSRVSGFPAALDDASTEGLQPLLGAESILPKDKLTSESSPSNSSLTMAVAEDTSPVELASTASHSAVLPQETFNKGNQQQPVSGKSNKSSDTINLLDSAEDFFQQPASLSSALSDSNSKPTFGVSDNGAKVQSPLPADQPAHEDNLDGDMSNVTSHIRADSITSTVDDNGSEQVVLSSSEVGSGNTSTVSQDTTAGLQQDAGAIAESGPSVQSPTGTNSNADAVLANTDDDETAAAIQPQSEPEVQEAAASSDNVAANIQTETSQLSISSTNSAAAVVKPKKKKGRLVQRLLCCKQPRVVD